MSLQFKPKQPPPKRVKQVIPRVGDAVGLLTPTKASKPVKIDPSVFSGGLPPHKPVKVAKIAGYLGVDIRIIHGYIRRGALKSFYPPGAAVKYVYADEAALAVRKSSVVRGGSAHQVRENTLLSWNKGDGRREVGWVQGVTSNGSCVVETSHKTFPALIEGLEKALTERKVVLESPRGVLELVLRYLEVTEGNEAPTVVKLRAALQSTA